MQIIIPLAYALSLVIAYLTGELTGHARGFSEGYQKGKALYKPEVVPHGWLCWECMASFRTRSLLRTHRSKEHRKSAKK
jgi:hypothetical protein